MIRAVVVFQEEKSVVVFEQTAKEKELLEACFEEFDLQSENWENFELFNVCLDSKVRKAQHLLKQDEILMMRKKISLRKNANVPLVPGEMMFAGNEVSKIDETIYSEIVSTKNQVPPEESFIKAQNQSQNKIVIDLSKSFPLHKSDFSSLMHDTDNDDEEDKYTGLLNFEDLKDSENGRKKENSNESSIGFSASFGEDYEERTEEEEVEEEEKEEEFADVENFEEIEINMEPVLKMEFLDRNQIKDKIIKEWGTEEKMRINFRSQERKNMKDGTKISTIYCSKRDAFGCKFYLEYRTDANTKLYHLESYWNIHNHKLGEYDILKAVNDDILNKIRLSINSVKSVSELTSLINKEFHKNFHYKTIYYLVNEIKEKPLGKVT